MKIKQTNSVIVNKVTYGTNTFKTRVGEVKVAYEIWTDGNMDWKFEAGDYFLLEDKEVDEIDELMTKFFQS